MNRLHTWLLPAELQDEELPLAKLTVDILAFSSVTTLLMALATYLDAQAQASAILAVTALALIVALGFIRLGFITLAKYLTVLVAWGAVSLLVLQIGDGTKDVQIIGFPIVIILGGLLLGTRGAVTFALLSALSFTGSIYAQKFGIVENRYADRITTFDAFIGTVLFGLTAATQHILFRNLTQSLERAQEKELLLEKTNEQLKEAHTTLKKKVEERTAQLQASAEVARNISTITDPAILIQEVVNLISRSFGFYYTAIFIADSSNTWAVLRNASGEAGKELLKRGHRLEIGGQSMVGTAMALQEARIAFDVGQVAIRFDNPLLPKTRSEIALPLLVGEKAIGALDVQSTREAAFSIEDIETLQSMANQAAVALENARLYQESQSQLTEINRISRFYLQEGWSDLTQRGTPAYQFTPAGIEKKNTLGISEMQKAIKTHSTQITHENNLTSVSVPIILRGQTIGALNLKVANRQFTSEELMIIDAVTAQAALALENARLLEESRNRVAQEQFLGTVSSRMREILDVETILKTTIREIGDNLGLTDIEVHLDTT